MKKSIGIHRLYTQDPIQADEQLWGRKVTNNRRGFLKKSALTAMSVALGGKMVFAEHFPSG